MAADSYDITLEQDRDFFWGFRWKVGRTEKVAVAKPGLADYSFVMAFKANYDDVAYLLAIGSDTGEMVYDSVTDKVVIHITAAQTDTLPAGKCKYEIVGYSPDVVPVKTGIARGIATVNPKVV